MMKSSLFLIIFGFGIVFCSCNKEETPVTKTELLTNKSWVASSKIISPSYSMGGITITDLMVLESDEVKNYSFKYNSDGTLITYNKSNQIVFQTNWKFNGSESQITYNPPFIISYPPLEDIELTTITMGSITKNKLIITTPYLFQGTNYLVTTTFTTKM